jgi:hypothetical protein
LEEIDFLKKSGMFDFQLNQILICDDGSSALAISKFYKSDIFKKNSSLYKVLNSNIRTGSQKAILRGLNFLSTQHSESYALIMDGDGEDKPQDINSLFVTITGSSSAVLAIRGTRHASKGFKIGLKFFQVVYRTLTGKKFLTGNFSLLGPETVKEVLALTSSQKHLSVSMIRYLSSIDFLKLDRGKRYRGKSKMNLSNFALHAFGAISVNSDIALIRLSIASFLTSVFLISVGIILFFLKFFSIFIFLPGWTSILILEIATLSAVLTTQAIFALLLILSRN